MSEEAKLWAVMIGKDSYGPYSTEEMIRYCREGRVVASSPVRHREATKGQWQAASTLPQLARCFPPPVPVVQAKVVPPEIDPFTAAKQAIERSKSHGKPSKLSPIEVVFAFFDPTFKHRLTPLIVKFTWISAIAFVLLIVVNRIVVSILMMYPSPPSDFPEPINAGQTVMSLLGVLQIYFFIFLFYAVLWIRVLLEFAMGKTEEQR